MSALATAVPHRALAQRLGLAHNRQMARSGHAQMNSDIVEPATPEERGVHLRVVPAVRPRVLVIDDDPVVLKTFGLLLRHEFDVELALGGRAGLEQLASGEQFDAIVCDLQMPEVDGPAVLARLRAHDPRHAGRLMFCTGALVGGTEASGSHRPQAPVLHKPCTREQLVAALRDIVGRG
ncbi:MAG: response regulator [Myxococcales bacterium FL481]|nr:MAG: response regulator [Myxococcales bacterium FL481]